MIGQEAADRHRMLLERERELSHLAAGMDALPDGAGGLFIVEGPAGIGKTEVLAAARRLALDRGMQVLHARGTDLEAAFAYGIVRQLLEPPLAAATPGERIGLLQGAASGCRPLLTPDGTDSDHSFDPTGISLLHALWWLTFNLASQTPALITVDDAQWADPASLRFLLYLANRLESMPALLLVTVRSGERGPVQLNELIALPQAEVLQLRPLSGDATQQLVRAGFSETASDEFCAICHEATDGNPFLLNELLRAVADGSINPDREGAIQLIELGSRSVSRSVLRRLERLGPEALELARALAIWGGRAELHQAAAAAGIDEDRAGAIADDLASIDILKPSRPLEFVHPLVRAAIYSDLPSTARGRGHRQVADALARGSAPPEQVAAHLSLTEPGEDASVVRMLSRGAGQALARGSPEGAKQYLERALREPPARDDLGEVLCKLGVAERRIDPKAAVGHLSKALEVSAGEHKRGAICLELIHAHLQAGSVEEAERVVRPVIADLRQLDREFALRLEAELIIALRQGLAASPLADERLDRWAGRIAGSSPAERLILSQLAVRAALTGAGSAEVAELAERALGDGLLLADQSSESLAAYLPLYPLMCADRFESVGRHLDQALQDARARGSPVAFAMALAFRANLSLAMGDVRTAELESSDAVDIVRSFGLSFLLPGAVAPGIEALIEADELEQAEAMLAEHRLDGLIADTVPGRIFRACRGRLRLEEGRTADGMKDLLDLMRTEDERGPSNLYLTPYRPWAALGLLQSGQREAAARLVRDEVAAARAWGSPRILAMSLTMAGRVVAGPAGLELFREAASLASGSPARLAEAYALTELGVALRRTGLRLDAVGTLRRALDRAHHCGAERLAARARAELVVLGARPRRHALTGAEALTAGERRVAELAASGMTNRQIAENLFLTTRTVEHHLTHTYQKLGIRSRSELERALDTP